MNYLSPKSEAWFHEEAAITLKQPGVNNVGTDCICSKEHFWLQSIYVI